MQLLEDNVKTALEKELEGAKFYKWSDKMKITASKTAKFMEKGKIYVEHVLLGKALIAKGEAVAVA